MGNSSKNVRNRADEQALDATVFELMASVREMLVGQGEVVNTGSILRLSTESILSFYSKSPLELSPELEHLAITLTERWTHDVDKAKAIYDWIVAHIRYGVILRGAAGYRTSLETYRTREGVCGEMAILFVAMAQAAGIQSAYASVRRDVHGEKIAHACAAIASSASGVPILVDMAYRTFGVNHREYVLLDQKRLSERFSQYRRNVLVCDDTARQKLISSLFPA